MINDLLREAQAAQRAGNLPAARGHLEAALARAPTHPAALNSLGVVRLALGDTRGAIDAHRRATEADPSAPVLWMNLAKAQREASDSDGEATSLDAALAIDAVYFPALVRKAELCERRGDTVEALRLWQGVIATAPAGAGGLDAILAHARGFVAAQTAHFTDAIESGLAAERAKARGALRRFDAAVSHATGRRTIYANQCAGFHFPFLPADEFFERDHFPWLACLEAQTQAIRAELESLLATGAPGFAPYVNMAPGTPENKWSALDGKMTWGAYYLWHYGKPSADAHARCPKTVAALADVPQLHLKGRCPSAFFSLLEPGARIPPHTGVTNIRTIVHLPLIVPEKCGFRVGGETREWREGEAFAFDDTIEHEAWNGSSELRAVLILDVWNPYLSDAERTLVERFFDVAEDAGLKTGAVESF